MKSLLFLQGFFKKSNMLLNYFLLKLNPLFTRAFKRFSAGSLLKSFLFLSLYSVGAKASIVPIDPCQDPLEIAALFSNMKQPTNTLEDQIKRKEALVEKYEKQLEFLIDGDGENYGVDVYIENLADSLNADSLDLRKWEEEVTTNNETTKEERTETIYNVASDLASYMENQDDHWGCSDRTETPENDPSNDCRAWQLESDKQRTFKNNGKINAKGFCVEHASNRTDCKEALKKLKETYTEKREIDKSVTALTDEIWKLQKLQREKEIAGESEQQAGFEPCWDCVEKVRDLNKPGWGEITGNVLTTGLGVALSVFGAREGRRAGGNANEWLALQGSPARNNFGYSLAGASLGMPFIYNGIQGLTRSNAARGGYGCSPTASHHASMHPMMQQQMMQHQMQQQAMMHGGNPYAAMMNPSLAQFQVNNPYASPYANPLAQFQVNNPYASPYANPMAQFQVNNPYASPYANPMAQFQVNNPFASPYANPMAQFQVNNPYASPYANPMAQFQVNNSFAMNPMMQMPGMNSMYATQYSQQAMQQLQMQAQIDQAVLAQKQSIMQERIQTQQVLAGLMQEAHKINTTIKLVASGGVRALAGTGSLSAGITIGGITGSNSVVSGLPGVGGAPQHNPVTAPSSTPAAGNIPIRTVR